MKKKYSGLLWVVAFFVTALLALYQKRTGPTYPVKDAVDVAGRKVVFRLPRSHGGAGDAEIRLHVPDQAITGTLEWRRFRSHDEWRQLPLQREGDTLAVPIPHQPPAGKVMYRIFLRSGEESPVALTSEPVVIRFRGGVPAFVLILHIVVIFAGMLLSTRTGFEALCGGAGTIGLTRWTLGCLVVGGLILGPVVQKYAFDAFWTGWPFGHDLTDNKLAFAVFFWLIALWRGRKNRVARGWVITAALVTLVIWLIPHSLLGSELDYTQMSP
ncbi:MAG: hypothetical protein KAY37_01620 [Phycisphaerae bacterium]|nr:hypothetical protein [Phycisphaerae bacterium]